MPIDPILKIKQSRKIRDHWPLNMGLTGCPEILVTSYQLTPYNIPEDQRRWLHYGGSV